MVEFVPATDGTRVRIPASAFFQHYTPQRIIFLYMRLEGYLILILAMVESMDLFCKNPVVARLDGVSQIFRVKFDIGFWLKHTCK